MLYNFLLEFVEIFGFLNVFKYITFRTGLAVFTSLILVLIIGGPFIKMVSDKKIVAKGIAKIGSDSFDESSLLVHKDDLIIL